MPEITEQQVISALHGVPAERWREVIALLQSLQPPSQPADTGKKPMTAADLAQSGLVGMWRDRTDIESSQEFARQLREQAEHCGGVR